MKNFTLNYLNLISDFQVIFLVVLFGLFGIVLERFFPLFQQPAFYRRKDSLFDFLLFIIGFIANPLFSIFILSSIDSLLGFQKIKIPLLGFFGFIFLFLITDFIKYWAHRLAHEKPFWKFHIFHHSAKNVDWLTAERVYFLDDWLNSFFTSLPLLFFTIPANFYLYLLIIGRISSFINHANINFSLGPLNKFFLNPRIHRWHHSDHMAFKNGQNFGGVTLLWDHIFKTFYFPQIENISCGVPKDQFDLTRPYKYLILAPWYFLKSVFER